MVMRAVYVAATESTVSAMAPNIYAALVDSGPGGRTRGTSIVVPGPERSLEARLLNESFVTYYSKLRSPKNSHTF